MRVRVSKFSLVFLLVVVSILILHYSGILMPVENLAVRIVSPIGRGFYHFGQKIKFFQEPQVSSDDYARVEAERNKLMAQNAELQILEKENQELRKALEFAKNSQQTLLTASIIGRDPNFANYFILDRGTEDGIGGNYPVVSPEGILVGKIIKTEAKNSVFIIPTDTNFQTAAAFLGKTKKSTAGLVRGERGLGIKMEFIPQDEPIEKDDIVITSGLELNMPDGLVIGKVAEVEKEDRDVFSRATISPLVSYEDLSIVMVVIPQ